MSPHRGLYLVVPFIVGALIMAAAWAVVDRYAGEEDETHTFQIGLSRPVQAMGDEGDRCSFDSRIVNRLVVRTSEYDHGGSFVPTEGTLRRTSDGDWRCVTVATMQVVPSPFYVLEVNNTYRRVVTAGELTAPGLTLLWPDW